MTLARARRRARADFKKFSPLVSSPFALGSAAAGNPLPNVLTLPAQTPFGITLRHSSNTTVGHLRVLFRGRTIQVRAGSAGRDVPVELFGETGMTIQVLLGAGVPSGTVSLGVRDQLGRISIIATGTVS